MKVYQLVIKDRTPDMSTKTMFGSLAAIYTEYTPEQIGCKVEQLWKAHIEPGNPFENKLCYIKCEVVKQKPTNRNRKHYDTE